MTYLGPCCACGADNSTVRNILSLDLKAPVPATGWGCVVCHLPNDGALAVLCDKCVQQQIKPTMACYGYPADCQRVPIANLTGHHRHDTEFHL
jgi:hypothetical protein